MAKKAGSGQGILSWPRFRGRNGVDDPNTLPVDMGTEAINWIITTQGLGHRRRGTVKVPITGTFTGAASMTRFAPTQNDGAARLVFSTFDTPTKFMQVAGGTAAVEVGMSEGTALVGSPLLVSYATGNGKLFAAFKNTAGNRLHVMDPTGTGDNVFALAGLIPSGPPSNVENVGSGGYPAVIRYYRIQQRSYWGNTTQAVSALSASTAFTPSGAGAGVRISLPTTIPKATQWRVFASADNVLFYLISGWMDPSVTVFFDDFNLVEWYASYEAAPLEGSRYPLPGAKYILWDGVRLLLFGTQGDQTGNDLPAVPGRVYFTQALDATVEGGEDESIVMTTQNKGYIDISRNAGAEDRGLVGPIDGNILVMQSRGITLLKPTGAATRPYARITLTKEIGSVSHWASFVGEDEAGRPAIYWLDPHRGPYRYGADGLQWLGYDIQDLWNTFDPQLSTELVAHGLYDQRARRCYWWIVTGAQLYPTITLCFHPTEGRLTRDQGVRYGWTWWDGLAATGRCSVMFAETFGAPMARRLKPYLGYPNRIVQLDADDVNVDDEGQPEETAYAALVRSKAWNTTPAPQIVQLDKAWVRAECTNAILAQRLIRNYGDQEAILSTVPLAPQGTEARRIFLFEDAQLAGVWTFQTELGDALATDQFYAIDRWDARMTTTDLEVGTSEL
jgi:hypothetical protein